MLTNPFIWVCLPLEIWFFIQFSIGKCWGNFCDRFATWWAMSFAPEHPVTRDDWYWTIISLWHHVQTYLSYFQPQTIQSPAWVCSLDTIRCGAEHCHSIRDSHWCTEQTGGLEWWWKIPNPLAGFHLQLCHTAMTPSPVVYPAHCYSVLLTFTFVAGLHSELPMRIL